MAKIIGNTTATPNPRPDWAQTDETKADYIKNKPVFGALAIMDEETDPTVPDWAKEPTKPTYTPDELGVVAYTVQNLTEEQKAQARLNIGVELTTLPEVFTSFSLIDGATGKTYKLHVYNGELTLEEMV